jgi:hypothetical protein
VLSTSFRIFIIVILASLLSACHSDYYHYRKLFSDTNLLKTQLQQCSNSKTKSPSKTCEQAEIAQSVLQAYYSIELAQGKKYIQAQQYMQQLDQQLIAAGSVSARKAILAQQFAERQHFDSVYFAAPEEFGKLIMARETTLAKLKEQLAKAKKDSAAYAHIEKQIERTQQVLKAMLAFAALNGAA